MTKMPEHTDGRHALIRFFANPVVGVLGSIASIVGLLLAVYFFAAARVSRELVYFVHPAKAAVVRAGHTSRLDISLDGSPVDRDVTAAQVAIWNAGKQPIRAENVLSPLVIQTGKQNPILEARFRKTTRDVVGLDLNMASIRDGKLQIDWRILEQHDGGVLQIIFFGDVDTEITASATIEGQGDIRKLEYGAAIQTGAEQFSKTVREERVAGFTIMIIGIAMVVTGCLLVLMRLNPVGVDDRGFGAGLISIGLMVVGGSLCMIFWFGVKPGPPFGF